MMHAGPGIIPIILLSSLLVLNVAAGQQKDARDPRWSQITVESVLARQPNIKAHMPPAQIARLINEIPLGLREEFRMAIFTVLGGRATINCVGKDCSEQKYFGELAVVKDFIDSFSGEMQLKDMYFVMYCCRHLNKATIRQYLNLAQTDASEFQKIYQRYSEMLQYLPAITMTADIGEQSLQQNNFVIPDAYMLQGFRQMDRLFSLRRLGIWEDNLKDMLQASVNLSWREKDNQAFWRGDDSGSADGVPLPEIWSNLGKYIPRMELIRLSKSRPDKIDAKLTSLQDQFDLYFKDAELTQHLETSPVPVEEQTKHRYLLSLDGDTADWMRLPLILASKSVLIRQDSTKVEWFDYALKPNIHYYPVRSDLSDLIQAIAYLEDHQQFAQELIKNANKFVAQYFTREKIKQSAIKVFKDYAAAQNHTFSELDRELIMNYDMPYHTFAHQSMDRKIELLSRLRFWRVIYWLVGFCSVALLVVAWRFNEISKTFKGLTNRYQFLTPSEEDSEL